MVRRYIITQGGFMKKLLIASLIGFAVVSAQAHGPYYHGYRQGWHSNPGWWVAPAVIGGVIGYEINRPPVYTAPPVIVQQQPMVIQSNPTIVSGQNCGPWTEIRNADGSTTYQRTCQ